MILVPGVVRDAEAFLGTHAATRERFERAARLVEGFETPFGLELLSTVHWLITKEQIEAKDALVQAVHDWIPRKRRFTPEQIELTAARIRSQGWI